MSLLDILSDYAGGIILAISATVVTATVRHERRTR